VEEPCPPSAAQALDELKMAAQRIRAANSSGLLRCKSEGTLIDLSEGFSESSLCDVKGGGTGGGHDHQGTGQALAWGHRVTCKRRDGFARLVTRQLQGWFSIPQDRFK